MTGSELPVSGGVQEVKAAGRSSCGGVPGLGFPQLWIQEEALNIPQLGFQPLGLCLCRPLPEWPSLLHPTWLNYTPGKAIFPTDLSGL